MFLQAGGGGKGIRPIQQTTQQAQSQQGTQQQQSQQHQNQIPTHHHHQQQQQQQHQQQHTQQALLTPSSSTHSLQAHHQPSSSQTSLHHQHQHQHQHHGQQQSTTHLSNIQSPLLPHPTQAGQHHQQTLHHHHHPAIPYYTIQLSQAPQPPTHATHHQQQQVPNNGAAAASLILSPPPPPTHSTSANVSNSTTSICSNSSSNTILRQHSAGGNNAIQTIYAPNTTLLQSTATQGFMTPYMQQYPLQTTVLGAAAATALYANPANNGTSSGNGNVQNGAATQQTFYQMTQQPTAPQQQQPIMQYFHAIAPGPTSNAPPHLHPGQTAYRGVPNTAHNHRHGAPPTTYMLPTAQTQMFTVSPSQLTTTTSQRASLLPAPGQTTVATANGNIQMNQLLQATGQPTGATTYMQAAYCTAPMGMTPAALAGASPMLNASPLQTYGHLTNVTMSSSNTSMSSQSEGYTKPRKHAIPIIHPITNENILEPKPLQKSTSVEVKPSAPEFTENSNLSPSPNADTGCAAEIDSKSSSTSLHDKSITVSLPPCKIVTSSSSVTSTGSITSKDGKIDQQMQTDAVQKKSCNNKIEILTDNASEALEKKHQQENFLNVKNQTETVAQTTTVVLKREENVILEDAGVYTGPIFQPGNGNFKLDYTTTKIENVISSTADNQLESDQYYAEQFEQQTTKNDNMEEQPQLQQQTMTAEMQNSRIIHDKGQQIFIPKCNSEQPSIQIAKRDQQQNCMPTFSMNSTATTLNVQEQKRRDTHTKSIAAPTSATNCSTTTLVPTHIMTSSSSPIKSNNNGRRQRGGNKQSKFKNRHDKRQANVEECTFINFTDMPSTATSSCSSISSSSGIIHETTYSKTTLELDTTKSSTTLVGGNVHDNVVGNSDTTTFVKPATTAVWTAKHNQQQQQQQQIRSQQSLRNTPTTSCASSSTASTPTHQSQHCSTDTSSTPTNLKRRNKKNKRDQKKKSENINRNQNLLNSQTSSSQQQLIPPTQKQPSLNSVRGSVSSNYNSNNNSNCSSNSNLNFVGSSSSNNHNNTNSNQNNNNRNIKNHKKATYPSNIAAYTNNDNNTTTTTTTQTDNNNAINYNSTSNYNNNNNNKNKNNNNNSNNNYRKNSSTNTNYKGNQLQPQQQQQKRLASSNNSDRSSRCSLTFGGIGSDVSSISETESKGSISALCSDVGIPEFKLNLSSENDTPSSSCLTSPKSNSRHWRTHEIVAQYLTDRSSDKNPGSDDQTIQFLHGSSSTCEDEEDSNSHIEFDKKDLMKYDVKPELEQCQQEPLEFGSNELTLAEIDEVYFGDFCDEKDLKKSIKTDDAKHNENNVEQHNVKITKIPGTQKTRKSTVIADTVDCVPIKPVSSSDITSNVVCTSKNNNNRKITILKSNDKTDTQTKQRNFEAAMRPTSAANTTQPTTKEFYRYTLAELRELANAPFSRQAPMVNCQGDCVSQLFTTRQQHHLPTTHQTHGTLSALALQQHLQQYQQISYNESLEFVSSNKRRGGGGGGIDRLKKHHEHMTMMGLMPGSGGSVGGIAGGGGINSNAHQHKKDIIRVHLSLKEEIKLSECENAWTPDTLRGISISRAASSSSSTPAPSNNDLEAVLKKVRGVLNKLTPNNFNALLKELTNISMNTQEKMQQVMLLIFEKTVSEPNFAPTYAKFCKVLFQEIKAETKLLFSNLLITRIQHEFETNVNDADAKQVKLQPLVDKLAACENEKEKLEIKAELEEQEYQFRRRAWGTVRFIGEMYKLQSLTSDRVLQCIESLLEHGSEEKLEFMCKLLTTVGYLLEVTTPENFTIKTRIDNVFKRMQEIVQKTRGSQKTQQQQQQLKISSRVRFMLQDVMDLRARHWDQQKPRTAGSAVTNTTTTQQATQQQQQSMRRKDEKASGSGGSGSSSLTHEKQSSRGGGGGGGSSSFGNSNTGGNQVSSHRQQRGSGNMSQNDGHFYQQKGSKHYNHQQQEQKVNIDLNKLKFSSGDGVTPSTTKLGSPSLYLWRPVGRQMATTSASSLTTSTSATSATSAQKLTLSTQSSNSSTSTGVATTATTTKTKRQTSNPFEVLNRNSPTLATVANSSDVDDAFTDENTDETPSSSSAAAYTKAECKKLVNSLVEEMLEVAVAQTSWQAEAFSIWRKASTKQQVSLLHYLLMDYLHLGDVKSQQREACSKILAYLMNTAEIKFEKCIFTEAYGLFGEEFPDLLVDVPNGWEYVFEFLGPMLHEELLNFEDIWLTNWSEDTYCTERFLKGFINYFNKKHGEDYTHDLWHKRFKLEHGQKFQYDEQRFTNFVISNHCEYLLKAQNAALKNVETVAECVIDDNSTQAPKNHIEHIAGILRQQNGSNMVMDYIIKKVDINSKFLRGITELFCCDIATSNSGDNNQSSSSNKKERQRAGGGNKTNAKQQQQRQRHFELEIFRDKCLPILRLVIDSNETLELGCLDAIFEISLDHYDDATANKMICKIFELFYDAELIPKETFEKWYRTQSLVDEAIESAGNSSSTDTKTAKYKPSTPKKHGKSHTQSVTAAATKNSTANSSSNISGSHKISAELHSFMRKLL